MAGGHRVPLTHGAEQDSEAIYDYIAELDAPAKAQYVSEQLTVAAEKLAVLPERGNYPKELMALGIKDYRRVFFKPYRLICRFTGDPVLVYVIADGRRDMQALLTRRLLAA